MKITGIRIRRVEGEMEHAEPFWEERLVRPVGLYPLRERPAGNPMGGDTQGDGCGGRRRCTSQEAADDEVTHRRPSQRRA